MSDIFQEVMQDNAWTCQNIEVEPAIGMPGRVTGICIDICDAEAPIFISSEQLRKMAEEADKQ